MASAEVMTFFWRRMKKWGPDLILVPGPGLALNGPGRKTNIVMN